MTGDLYFETRFNMTAAGLTSNFSLVIEQERQAGLECKVLLQTQESNMSNLNFDISETQIENNK